MSRHHRHHRGCRIARHHEYPGGIDSGTSQLTRHGRYIGTDARRRDLGPGGTLEGRGLLIRLGREVVGVASIPDCVESAATGSALDRVGMGESALTIT